MDSRARAKRCQSMIVQPSRSIVITTAPAGPRTSCHPRAARCETLGSWPTYSCAGSSYDGPLGPTSRWVGSARRNW
eukprot:3035082-Pyramimonas_sp.AAC.1